MAGLHPEDRAATQAAVDRALDHAGNGQYRAEYRVIRPPGADERWVAATGQVYFEAGRPVRLIGTVQDITDRKLEEAQLARMRDQLAESQRIAQLGSWEYIAATGELTWSDEEKRIYGLDPAQPPPDYDTMLRQHIHPEDQAELDRRFRAAMASQAPYEIEHRVLRPDGTIRWTYNKARPYLDGQGRLLRYVGTTLDITDRKRAEEELARERDLLQAVLDSAGQAHLVYLDRDFNFVRVNRAYAATCGYRPQEMIGKNHFALYPHAENEAIFRRVRDTGQPFEVRDKPFEFPGHPERGVTYWDWSLVPVKDSSGQVTGLIFSLFQTTARKQAEEALRSANAALKHANTAKDAFLAKLSHELRTPLTPVVALLSSVASDRRLPEDLREDMAMLQRNINLQVHLVNDLLDVTRIVSGKLELHKRPVEIAAILQHVGRMLTSDLDARGQHLAIRAQGPCWVQADASRLHQVFWNLVKNASKFSLDQSPIQVEVQAEHGRVKITVRDRGRGVAPDDLPRLFSAFEQGAAGHGFGGLGLGLAICRGIVEAHGGTISAHSKGPGKGAEFTVTLPTCPAPAHGGAAHEKPAIPGSRPLRILLVEDHSDTARIVTRLLRGEGHRVTAAATVAGGLAAATAGEFDVLMSDLGLPDGSGYDLMRQLIAAGKPLPGIAVSGHGSTGDVQKSLEAGFVEHLTKPVSFDVLQQVLLRIGAAAGHR